MIVFSSSIQDHSQRWSSTTYHRWFYDPETRMLDHGLIEKQAGSRNKHDRETIMIEKPAWSSNKHDQGDRLPSSRAKLDHDLIVPITTLVLIGRGVPCSTTAIQWGLLPIASWIIRRWLAVIWIPCGDQIVRRSPVFVTPWAITFAGIAIWGRLFAIAARQNAGQSLITATIGVDFIPGRTELLILSGWFSLEWGAIPPLSGLPLWLWPLLPGPGLGFSPLWFFPLLTPSLLSASLR